MARVKKSPIDRLRSDIQNLLEEYGDEVDLVMTDVVKDVTKLGVKAVKANSRATFGGTGKYASGWTSQYETKRYSKQGIIYNSDVPGLPHLLENGHAKRGGGRVPGRSHIAPVEEELIRTFEEVIKAKL